MTIDRPRPGYVLMFLRVVVQRRPALRAYCRSASHAALLTAALLALSFGATACVSETAPSRRAKHVKTGLDQGMTALLTPDEARLAHGAQQQPSPALAKRIEETTAELQKLRWGNTELRKELAAASERAERAEQAAKQPSPALAEKIEETTGELQKLRSENAELRRELTETSERAEQAANQPSPALAEKIEETTAELQKLRSENAELRRELTETSERAAKPAPAPAETVPATTSAPAAAVSDTPASQSDATATSYRIQPFDVLEIYVWKNQDLTKTVTVRPEGNISLPLLNDVQAAGLTPVELRDRLTERLAGYYKPPPEVSVLVNQVHGYAISVFGEVQKPGRFDVKGSVTVLDALALAGGLTQFASTSKISVLRAGQEEGKERIPFRYSRALQGDPKENFQLQPGDIVVAP